jgi:hypothetical protein
MSFLSIHHSKNLLTLKKSFFVLKVLEDRTEFPATWEWKDPTDRKEKKATEVIEDRSVTKENGEIWGNTVEVTICDQGFDGLG